MEIGMHEVHILHDPHTSCKIPVSENQKERSDDITTPANHVRLEYSRRSRPAAATTNATLKRLQQNPQSFKKIPRNKFCCVRARVMRLFFKKDVELSSTHIDNIALDTFL